MECNAVEFFEMMTKYILKSLHNTSQLISHCVGEISDKRIMPFIITKLAKLINNNLAHHSKLLNIVVNNNELFLNIQRLIINLQENLNKEFSYQSFDFMDFLIINLSPENLIEKINVQKAFSQNYVKTLIKEKLTQTINKNEFISEEIFNLIKLIIKDNLSFVNSLINAGDNLHSHSIENNFIQCCQEVLHLCKSPYNEEVKLFYLSKHISRKKMIFMLDLVIKLKHLLDRIILSNQKFKFTSEQLKQSTNIFINSEVNKTIENFTLIIVKDLNSKGIEELIKLFTYDGLINLEVSSIDTTFSKVNKTLDNFLMELESIKINFQTEVHLIDTFLDKLINSLIDELDKSLKRIPRNKNFSHLTSKTSQAITRLVRHKSRDEEKDSKILLSLSNLESSFSSLKMNKLSN